ncbi:hypothetical protein F4806DRAFT_161896 [Annulohypoxylon nitens]|nr:hypothetical protein F4806DRAFT_161896 [Annulohypoxylon nitens]
MTPSSTQSVIHGFQPKRSAHDRPENPGAASWSLIQYLSHMNGPENPGAASWSQHLKNGAEISSFHTRWSHNSGPVSERLVSGRPQMTSEEQAKLSIEGFQHEFVTRARHKETELSRRVTEGFQHEIVTGARHKETELSRRITEWILNWLRRWAASAPLTDGSSGASGTSGSSHVLDSAGSSKRPRNSNAAGKRRGGPGDGGDKNDNNQPKKAKTGHSPVDKPLYLACPFLKNNPEKYALNPRCCGSWPNVSRLKNDHIYPCHEVPGIQCERCGDIIEDHNRLEHAKCAETGNFTRREGADAFKMSKLRSKSTARNESEEEKWYAIFKILFGIDGKQYDISPYPDNNIIIRQLLVNFLKEYVGSVVARLLGNHNVDLSLQEPIITGVTDGLIGLVRGLQPYAPLAASHYTFLSTNSTGIQGETLNPDTDQMTQYHTLGHGYPVDLNDGNVFAELFGDGPGFQAANDLSDMINTNLQGDLTESWNDILSGDSNP